VTTRTIVDALERIVFAGVALTTRALSEARVDLDLTLAQWRVLRISDVAGAVGVSRMAVSYAFNRPDRLSAELRQRILDVAAELGYRPSPLARQLALGGPTSSAS
jgi:hypothetical protein